MTERICREKKTRKVTSYYTETEYAELERQAQQEGIRVSALQRRTMLAGEKVSYDPKKHAKLCNRMNYMTRQYSDLPGFREDMETLNESIQRTVFGGIWEDGNIEDSE